MTIDTRGPVRFIYVGGPFGSGTTALAGALAMAGVDASPPYFITNDPRTGNAYESVAFREIINRYVSERGFRYDTAREGQLIADLAKLKQAIIARAQARLPNGGFTAALFKMPISALCLTPILKVFEPRVLLTLRPLGQIEASRRRRGWSVHYGLEGAKTIYSALFQVLIAQGTGALAVGYGELLANPRRELVRVLQFAGLPEAEFNLDAAVGFVRQPQHDR